MSDGAPKPSPLNASQEEAIAFNLCSLHGFDPDFVKTQRDFALAVISEYERARPRLAPVAETAGEAADDEWLLGLIGEAVIMAEDQERADQGDAELRRISEGVLAALLPYLATTEASPTETGEDAYIVWNQDRSEAVLFTDIGREPGEPSAQDDALTASIGICGSVSSVLGEAFHEAFEDDEQRPVQRVPLAALRPYIATTPVGTQDDGKQGIAVEALERISGQPLYYERDTADGPRRRCPSCAYAWSVATPEHHAPGCTRIIASEALVALKSTAQGGADHG